MSMGGGTTNSTSQPYGPAAPYLSGVLGSAQNTFNSQGPYPGLSPATTGAMDLTASRALTGSPLVQTAQNTLQNFAGGGATNNPYLDQMFGRAADKVRDYTNAQFTMGGRGGSVTNQDILGQNIGDLAAQMYGNAYETGQSRQLAATQLAPGLANQDYTDLSKLMGVGQMQDQWNQSAYNQPWTNLQNYSNIVNGVAGQGRSTSQTAPSYSALPSLLGGGLSSNFGGLLGGSGGGGGIWDLLGSFPGDSNGQVGSGLLGTLFDTGGNSLWGTLGSLF